MLQFSPPQLRLQPPLPCSILFSRFVVSRKKKKKKKKKKKYFPPVRRDRTAQGGGVAIWIRADLAFTELECIDTGGNEILWVRLKTAAGPSIGVCAVYRSGSSADGDISALNSIIIIIIIYLRISQRRSLN